MEVALFPIPGSVCFPGVACPLHVFEPRYRQMIHHCLEHSMMLGVCHTSKVVHSKPAQQTLQEAMSSNQATYKPVKVFSAGPVELREELTDGRLLISVHAAHRLTLGTERQTLPFSIWDCDLLLDEEAPDDATREAHADAQEKVLQRLIAITDNNPSVQEQLKSAHWRDMEPGDFSFAVSGILGIPPELSQELLETTDTGYRLERILGLLNGATPGQAS